MDQEQINLNEENNFDTQDNNRVSNKHSKKKSTIILIIGVLVIIASIIGILTFNLFNQKNSGKVIKPEEKKSSYWISGNSLEPFDLYFLHLENEKKNKVYSPLSIKYALKMLEEGADGETKNQISRIIGNYEAKNYINSKNMSFANAIFIKDTYKDSIKDGYKNALMDKYNAEVKIDSFETSDTVNSWVKDKTLGLISNLFDNISQQKFLLINALAIDMEWEQKFLRWPGRGVSIKYSHENFSWYGDSDIVSKEFKDVEEEVAGLEIIASFNNYDIVNVLGESNIRQTVKTELKKYLEENPEEQLSDEEIEDYLDIYIEGIDSNYGAENSTTDFSLYVDDNVKVFAKDLKEYDGTTLQYVGIMPTNEELDNYISHVSIDDINNIIKNLKGLKAENFKDGVVTKITGFIPKFKFEYELNLIQDLKKLGVTNVFEDGQSNLKNISNDSLYINNAVHKANIEFTQEGIKASAATEVGGAGAGGGFDYCYDVPVEEIDLTFDKPYMFIIRNKNTGEVWFVGTVYNPLLYSQDKTINIQY